MSTQNITTYSTETFFDENEPDWEAVAETVQFDMEAAFVDSAVLYYNMIANFDEDTKTTTPIIANPTDPPLDDL